MNFATAGDSITTIDDAIRKLEEVKTYLTSKALILDDNFDSFNKMLEEVNKIAEEMVQARTALLQSSSVMSGCYDSFK